MTGEPMPQNFQYTSLDPAKSDIRLISLFPGKDSALVCCRIEHVSFNDNPSYEALSYTWGATGQAVDNIKVDGLPFTVTPSLEIALRHLRSQQETRILWIDALCINQLDVEERSLQVQKMKTIYQSASAVLVWLGEERDNSDLAMHFIIKLGNIDLDQVSFEIEDKITSKLWDALFHLLHRPWWSRSWVLQEIAVATGEPLMGCGQKWLPWSVFEKTQSLIARSTSLRVLQTMSDTVPSLLLIRKHRTGNQPARSLDFLLQDSFGFEATDPRDKIYSLLGLLHETDRVALTPDYSKSVRQVYIEIARHVLRKNINMLCLNTNSPFHDLPSWVSDWSYPLQQWPIWMPLTYNASGSSNPVLEFVDDLNILRVSGVIVDHISLLDGNDPIRTSQEGPIDSTRGEMLNNIESTLSKAIERKLLSNANMLNPDKSDVLWRTLVTNGHLFRRSQTQGPNTRAPEEFGRMFQVLRGRALVPADFMPKMPLAYRKEEYVKPFVESTQLEAQRFFVSRSGRIGLGPFEIREGDLVVVIFGGDMPLILRCHDSHHQLIGPAYVHGFLKGEIFKRMNKRQLRQRTEIFTIK